VLLSDNHHAWELQPSGEWIRQEVAPGERDLGTHSVLMRRARMRARKRGAGRPGGK
jgi:hypothetical protein